MKITGLVLCFVGSFLLYLSSTHTTWIVANLMSFYIGKFYAYPYLASISWSFIVIGFVLQLLVEFRKK